mmetsp:Transcript_25336/g.33068  ORF Transcript_25336/g.33068 Transcript_25336/m.33068 type:complete len:325 (-) Transcript_25336:183-1157(-)|eukprot:CAMPEP_0117744204 /NCGR_PEP_ID=MMETSP0947-20121206/6614_1 /TAXON_ID=44440 /ORGANISM="Chattonella subsalsa, Strain CCMP2191" /LENGTH=324 /DNA_ID=CAMNT_0005561097 /DNA_START=493 /DNA_END=1467 /DNA_ORIENTATION=+
MAQNLWNVTKSRQNLPAFGNTLFQNQQRLNSRSLISSSLHLFSTNQKQRHLCSQTISIAHRGSSSVFPGNSIEAFLEADRIGAEMIELDIAVCKSGEIIVHHDPYLPDGTLLRNAGKDQIKEFFPNIATFKEVLNVLKKSSVRLYLDMKGQNIVEPTLRLLHDKISNQNWDAKRFLVATFNQYDLLKVAAYKEKHSLLKKIETIVIIDAVPFGYAKSLQDLHIDYISVGGGCIIPEFVEDARKRGIRMMAWTVNNINMMKYFMGLGVYGICTDYPEMVAEVRSKLQADDVHSNAGKEFSGATNTDFIDPRAYFQFLHNDAQFSL